jgi:hypothetical protein
MQDIVKTCIHHGELTLAHVNKAGVNKYRCKLCMQASHARHYQRHKDKVAKKTKEWRQANPEKVREMRRAYQPDYRRKLRTTEQRRRYTKYVASTVNDTYVRHLLVGKSKDLTRADMPKELVELKRLAIQLKRVIRRARERNK